jgi:hypothetical protein
MSSQSAKYDVDWSSRAVPIAPKLVVSVKAMASSYHGREMVMLGEWSLHGTRAARMDLVNHMSKDI